VLEGLEPLDLRKTHEPQKIARGRSLYRERSDLLGDVVDLDLEADGGRPQPVELMLRGAQTVFVRSEAEHGAIIDEVSLIVAPHGVGHPARRKLAQIARRQAVQETQRIGAGNAVLQHRCQVVE